MNRLTIHFLLLICFLNVQAQSKLVDPKATRKTKALYANLFRVAEEGIMFGHEDDQAYGYGWWAEKGRSDVMETTGTYPAVHGWDIGRVSTQLFNLDTVDFKKMHRWIKATYKRGGINTISWHLDNPKTGGDSWERVETVKHILPGGSHHKEYLEKLDAAARFLKRCRAGLTRIPIVFRPFHEHNGSWFWWGKGHTSEEDYIALWRFTVGYLRDQKGLRNLLYAYSPDRSRMPMDSLRQGYLWGYPGDEYVDILGLDNYWDVGRASNEKPLEEQNGDFIESLKLIHELAEEKGKVAALTETGLAGLPMNEWFTRMILNPVKECDVDLNIAWVLVWRNRFEGFYTPHKDHAAADDFIKFEKDPMTLFESDIQNLYKFNKALIRK